MNPNLRQNRGTMRFAIAVQMVAGCMVGMLIPLAAFAQDSQDDREPGFEAFHIVWERNIFDATRRQDRVPEEVREPDEPPPPAPVLDQFYLLGTLITEYNSHAFFEGTSVDYQVVASLGQSIAGFQIIDIDTYRVTLEKDGKTIDVPIGSGMSRYDDGEWELKGDISPPDKTVAPSPSQNEPSEKSTESTTSNNAASDLLSRLMERRNQEMQR